MEQISGKLREKHQEHIDVEIELQIKDKQCTAKGCIDADSEELEAWFLMGDCSKKSNLCILMPQC